MEADFPGEETDFPGAEADFSGDMADFPGEEADFPGAGGACVSRDALIADDHSIPVSASSRD